MNSSIDKVILTPENNKHNLLILFDIDGTIAESSQQVSQEMIAKITDKIEAGYDIGIVGGGTFEKATSQLGPLKIMHYFTECGCVYHTRDSYGAIINVYKKNIRQHPLYSKINILVKEALQFIAKVDYEITGHFIDLRNGIIYISLIGMVATLEERALFIELNNKNNYRKQLINLLKNKAWELKIENDVVIAEGGTVGVGIYPKEYDKVQVMEVIKPFGYTEIHYFGDKYEKDGNDYHLLNHKNVIPHRVNNLEETMRELELKF
jgi:HAD superfamily hydrolase (TIGR01484 family)